MQVELRTGVVMRAPLGAHWRQPGSVELVGNAWDLQDACKQLALMPAHRCAAVVATPQESGAPQLWASVAMPFGTISSVHSFSRAGLALRSVAALFLGLLTANYLDDFPHLEAEELSGSAETLMKEVMEVLGRELSRNPEKSFPFAKDLGAFGVTISLRPTPPRRW